MDNISIKAIIKNTSQGIIIEPVTQADKTVLSMFTAQSDKKYVTVNLKTTLATKSYTQLKTAWALMTIIFQAMYGRKPTKPELDELHNDLLDEFADRKQSLLHADKSVPITLREMSSRQMSSFIQSLINILAEDCELSVTEQITAKDLFCEWENYLSSLKEDWNDFDENGEMIPMDIWRKNHTVSFASGLAASVNMQLDLAHIVTRGSDEIHRDCCWNTMMLTHEEHMKQHEIGWNNFLELYPHLRGRVERARRIAGKLALLEV